MKRQTLISTTVFLGMLACSLFGLSVYIGLTDHMPIDPRLWPGPDDANSQSQILWMLAAALGAAYFIMVQQLGVFDHIRISPILRNIRAGVPLGRIVTFVWAALITLGSGSCAANIAVQIADRYLNPSCFYQSPC